MKIQRCLLSLTFALLCLPLARLALGEPPNDARKFPAALAAVPTEASFGHYLRLRVKKVTPIERIKRTQLLKLEVERHYGKITAESHKRALEHETQRFTILFPASLDADVRAGDLIDYRIAAYHQMVREPEETEPRDAPKSRP